MNTAPIVRNILTAAVFAVPLLLEAESPLARLEIDLGQPGAKVSQMFYGLMTEEINHSYDGGLYAELIQNRSFKDDAKNPVHWSLVKGSGGDGSIALDEKQPVNEVLTTCLRLDANVAGGRVGIANDGFWGIPVNADTAYRASFFAKTTNSSGGALKVDIESTDGKTVYAQARVEKITGQWQKYTVTLKTATEVKATTDARLVISTESSGTFWFNLVSLFLPTWNNRPNGNRIDLMQHLVDLKPAFLRCPGGNYLEGNTIETRFQWKNTLGDISTRPGHMGCWGYRSSDGFGLLEFLEWAEDMGAEPVLAVYAGFSLPTHTNPRGSVVQAGPGLEPYVQEALEEIEYATGNANTKWGAKRVADGHPAPFTIHYIEIGNEDFAGDARKTYEARFAQFHDAIKAKYPDLKLIATIPVAGRTPDIVDDHYYQTSDQMAKLAHKYDKQDRRGPKAFVGEWATRELSRSSADGTVTFAGMPWDYKGAPTPDLHAALGDAAFMTGLERNADIVVMNCYAPLLVRVNPGGLQWCPNLIGYDSLRSYVSPSYYAQRMFNLNRGDTVAKAAMQGEANDLFYSATRSTRTGTVYLKVVNRAGTAQTVLVDLKNAMKVSPDGMSVVLTSSNPQDTNTITEPAKVVPVTEKISGVERTFTRTFAPYSINVLRIEAQ
jgi:alpha-N-arabinofuranosidase